MKAAERQKIEQGDAEPWNPSNIPPIHFENCIRDCLLRMADDVRPHRLDL